MGWVHVFKMSSRPLRRKLRNFILKSFFLRQLKKDFAHKSGPRFILMLTPVHKNLGDHAIAIGEIKLLSELNPAAQIIEVSELVYNACKKDLKTLIGKQDKIFIQGGGFFGNLYFESHDARREIIENFEDNEIICFPVSIYYTDNKEGYELLQRDKLTFKGDQQVTLMVRDEISFAFAKREFEKVNLILAPDCAMALETDNFIPIEERKGALFVWRKDKEKVVDNDMLSKILHILPKDTEYEIIDNIYKCKLNARNRAAAVYEQIAKIGKVKVIVTDRFHGVIFAAITHTPVIALPSMDSKITSGIKWFSELPYVHLAYEFSEVERLLNIYLWGQVNIDTSVQKKQMLFDSLRKVLDKQL